MVVVVVRVVGFVSVEEDVDGCFISSLSSVSDTIGDEEDGTGTCNNAKMNGVFVL